MGKIDLKKSADFNPIRTERQTDSVKSAKNSQPTVENKFPSNGDKLEISNRGSKVEKYVSELKDLPDLREEKINSLREQIKAGTYKPSSERIADAILKDEKM